MTLSHYSMTATGIEVGIDDHTYDLAAIDALHLMHLLLSDQIKLQFMLLQEQYPAALGADRARAEELAARMYSSKGCSLQPAQSAGRTPCAAADPKGRRKSGVSAASGWL